MIPRRSSGAHRANERQTLAPVFKKKKKKKKKGALMVLPHSDLSPLVVLK